MEKTSAEPSERKNRGPRVLVWGREGDGRQPKNEVKVERNECKRLHALEFGQSSGFRGQRKELWPHGLCNKCPDMRMDKGGGCCK